MPLKLVKTYAETAVALGHQHTFVVHGAGLDEAPYTVKRKSPKLKTAKLTTSP